MLCELKKNSDFYAAWRGKIELKEFERSFQVMASGCGLKMMGGNGATDFFLKYFFTLNKTEFFGYCLKKCRNAILYKESRVEMVPVPVSFVIKTWKK